MTTSGLRNHFALEPNMPEEEPIRMLRTSLEPSFAVMIVDESRFLRQGAFYVLSNHEQAAYRIEMAVDLPPITFAAQHAQPNQHGPCLISRFNVEPQYALPAVAEEERATTRID